MKQLKLFLKIFFYRFFRIFGLPKLLPINITLSLTFRCNSRCKTCNVYKRTADELSPEEIKKTFLSIGKSVYWLTLSGGEPFLRKDIAEICELAYINLCPTIINIPTNGILTETIYEKVKAITEKCKNSTIVVNLSIDEIGEKHDEIRQIKGNYEKVTQTYKKLREIKSKNLVIGIHSVISVFNVERFPEIYKELIKLNPDSYITEIAEERNELMTIGTNITPPLEKYKIAINFLISQIKQRQWKGIAKILESFRVRYYKMVIKFLETKTQGIPCFAGIASAQITPNGDVWFCCVRAEPIGNLRNVNYDFRKVWFSREAFEQRRSIKNKECACPLANVAYTNMLMDSKSILKIIFGILKWR